MDGQEHTARCACGSAAITLAGPVKIHAVCHCTNCKRRTGSAFGWSAYFPRDARVSTHGELVEYASTNPNDGFDQQRWFCARCGTTLFWHDAKFPALVGVAAGCFGESPPGTPTLSASHARKCAWVSLPVEWKTIDR